MKQGFVALGELLETHEKFPKAVVPGMCGFNDPAAVLRGAATFALLPADPRSIAASNDGLLCGLPVISAISIEEGADFALGLDHDERVENGTELGNVMPICSGHDQRQRDATPVHQQMTLAAFFSPDPSGSVLPLQFPLAT